MVDNNKIPTISSQLLLGTAKALYMVAVSFLVIALVLGTGIFPVDAFSGNIAPLGAVEKEKISGNPSCTSLGYDDGVKYDQSPAERVEITYKGETFTIFNVDLNDEGEGIEFDWQATRSVDAVIVKGRVYKFLCKWII